jgi:uncharacterized protein involved in exopolysaccharide biosynthesis
MDNTATRAVDHGTGRHSRGEVVSLTDIVAFLQRHLLLILAAAAIGALVAWLSTIVMARDVYRATATLVVVPPPIASELKPPTLTVQGYQKLLESDAVIAEAKRRLAAGGVIADSYRLAVGLNLSTEIFVSRRAEERELAPLLRAVASADDPQLAAAIANSWAGVFLQRTRELVAGSTSPAVSYIEQEYPKSRDRLEELEQERVAKANEYQNRFDASASSWDERIMTLKADHAREVSVYRAESERMISSLDAQLGLDGRAERVDALYVAAGMLQKEQATVTAKLAVARDELAMARELLAKTPPTLRLSKAMTDEALWAATVGAAESEIDWDRLRDRQLVTEESNPAYLDVSRRVASLEIEVAGLDPRAENLRERLAALAEEIRQLETAFAKDRSAVMALEEERTVGLTSIIEEGDLEETVMTRDRDRSLAMIERERDAALAKLERDLDQSRALFEELTVHYNQAVIAESQTEVEDVRLGAEAVPPTATEPRRGFMKVVLGVMLGALVGLVIAVFGDARPGRKELEG